MPECREKQKKKQDRKRIERSDRKRKRRGKWEREKQLGKQMAAVR